MLRFILTKKSYLNVPRLHCFDWENVDTQNGQMTGSHDRCFYHSFTSELVLAGNNFLRLDYQLFFDCIFAQSKKYVVDSLHSTSVSV